MPSDPDYPALIVREWQEYSAERERAARAAAIATRFEMQSTQAPLSLQPLRERMAELYRGIEERHLSCARLHQNYARRLQRWLTGSRATSRPVFMSAVAAQLGVDGAAITLFGPEREELLVAASDSTARTAHDLELTMEEGPARDVLNGNDLVLAHPDELPVRWPHFGPALTNLGVRAVLAVPLRSSGLLGAMCAYASRTELHREIAPTAGQVADVLTNAVLLAPSPADSDGLGLGGALFEEADYLSNVHQAVGKVAVQCGCDVDSAWALLRARAFASGISVEELARQVVSGGHQLC
ncbi:GAF and ANTAR domain-containing protein [Nocardia sp. NPDC127526]|uniref:GAF and ANTAR domain-containing protein n=1 Tax=Nocardia sp. NPDC127526 TaxID=3345393 RepID=UPI0036413E75